MKIILLLILGAICSAYVLLIFSYIRGWSKIRVYAPDESSKFAPGVRVSVVIALRNEEFNVDSLFQSIINQTYDRERTEFVFVDDHSIDKTYFCLSKKIEGKQNIKLFSLSDGFTGKKAALRLGLSHATGDVLVFTDADCVHHPNWLANIVCFFSDNNPSMIVAPVVLTGEGLFSQLQQLEFLSLMASTAGAVGIGRAMMCNGANMAFSKSALENVVDIYDQKAASGDDIFLLQKIKKQNKSAIHFLKSRQATVQTKTQATIREFFSQRIRWASKSSLYTDWDIICPALIVFSMSCSLLCLLFMSAFLWFIGFAGGIFSPTFTSLLFYEISIANLPSYTFGLFCILMIIKSIPDFILLYKITKFYNLRKLLYLFPTTQIAYIFYVFLSVFLGRVKKYRWKGRIYKE